MQSPHVFVIAPFDAEGRRVRDIVRRAIQETGLTVVIRDSDGMRPSAELTSTILDAIRDADLIVADVSRQNPNVLYEVGFAHALRKPTILLVSIKSGSGLPSDFAGLQSITYDPANLERLADLVKAETNALTMRRSA
jgi:nucleoside 2-deoxyribosyltransferase